jgi:hypothetical protein
LTATFYILDDDNASSPDARLTIEIGTSHIGYLVIDQNNHCIALAIYFIKDDPNQEKACSLLTEMAIEHPVFNKLFSRITIVYSNPVTTFVPSEFKHPSSDKPFIELLHGDTSEISVREDHLTTLDVYNIYGVNKRIEATVSYLFKADRSVHLYSLLPEIAPTDGNLFYCVFSNNHFTAMLVKEGLLQIIQTFTFKAPLDTVYYLLQLCNSFGLQPFEVWLELNGMIDEDSALYQELFKYFPQMKFSGLPENFTYPKGLDAYPSHYFSNLFAIAACGS